ncbi:hypothetical protein HDU76_002866 [Blyttiomyces sp. JEL0837]|nr:hypothetical protein HDU76_002866 [Blyttiomyces sp. JEL0837]
MLSGLMNSGQGSSYTTPSGSQRGSSFDLLAGIDLMDPAFDADLMNPPTETAAIVNNMTPTASMSLSGRTDSPSPATGLLVSFDDPPPPPSPASAKNKMLPQIPFGSAPNQVPVPARSTSLASVSSATSNPSHREPGDRSSILTEGSLFSLEDEDEVSRPLTGGDSSQNGQSVTELVAPSDVGSNAGVVYVEIAGQSLRLTQGDLQERITRLKKYEVKYPELARTFQTLAKRHHRIESVIKLGTPFSNGIQSSSDIEKLSDYLRDVKAKLEQPAAEEVPKLKRQISELREIQQLESEAKAEMFASLQAKVAERDEEIKRLKQAAMSSASIPQSASIAPTELPQSPPLVDISSDEPVMNSQASDAMVTMKLKMRELAAALKKVTEQRNKALEKCEELTEQLNAKNAAAPNQLVDIGLNDSPLLPNHPKSTPTPTSQLIPIESAFSLTDNTATSVIPLTPMTPTDPFQLNANSSSSNTLLTSKIHQLQRELDLARQKIKEENVRTDIMRNEVVSLRKALTDQQEQVRKKASRTSLRSLGSSSASLIVDISGSSVVSGSGLSINTMMSPSNGPASAVVNSPAVLTVAEHENGAEVTEEEGVLLDSMENVAILQTQLTAQQESYQKEKATLQARVTEAEAAKASAEMRMKEMMEDMKDARERLELVKSSSNKAMEEANLMHREEIANLEVRIATLKAKVDSLEAAKMQSVAGNVEGGNAAAGSELLISTARTPSPTRGLVPSTPVPVSSSPLHGETANWEEMDSLRSKIRDLEDQLSSKKKEAESMAVAVGVLQNELESKVTEMESMKKALSNQLAAASERANLSDKAVSETLEKLALAETGRKELFDKHKAAETRLKEVEEKAKVADEERATALQKMEKAYSVIRKTRQDMDTKMKEVEAAKKEHEEATKTWKEAERTLKERVAELEDDLRNKSAEGAAIASTLDLLKKQMSTVVLERDNSRDELSNLQSKLATRETELSSSRDNLNSIQAELENTKASAMQLSALKDELETAKTDHQKIVAEIQTKVDTLTNQLKESQKKNTELETSLSRLMVNNNQLLGEKAHLVSQLSMRAKAKDKNLVEAFSDIKSTESLLEETDLEAFPSAEQLDKNAEQLEKELALIREVEALKAEVSSLQGQLDAVKAASTSKVTPTTPTDSTHISTADAAETAEEMEGLLTKVSAQDSDLQSLRAQLVDIEVKLQVAQETALTWESRASSVRGENARLQEEVSNTTASLHDSLRQVAEVNSQLEGLRMTVKSLEEAVTSAQGKADSAEGALALTKQTLHERDEMLRERESMLSAAKKAYAEEEEKKNKSIQLLRSSKARILKLEETVKSKEGELAAVQAELAEVRANAVAGVKEREAQMASLTRQVEDMSLRLRKQKEEVLEAERRKNEREVEADTHSVRVQELTNQVAKLKAERDSLMEEDLKRAAEIQSSRSVLAQQASQLKIWPSRVSDLENRVVQLEGELETSKRLFENKSIEAETLMLRLSELERAVYESEQSAGSNASDVDSLTRDLMVLKRENSEMAKELKKRDVELKDSRKDRTEALELMERRRIETEKDKAELEAIKKTVIELETRDDIWRKKIDDYEAKAAEIESHWLKNEVDLKAKLDEKDKVLEDVKARESQLQKLNKALKDEVRKLSRAAGLATPVTTPPISKRASVIDQNDLNAANSTSPSTSATPSSIPPSSSNQPSSSSSVSSAPVASRDTAANASTGISNAGTSGTSSFVLPPPLSSPPPPYPAYPVRKTGSGGSESDEVARNLEYLKNVLMKFVESSKDKKASKKGSTINILVL